MVVTCVLYPRCPCFCHPEVNDECLSPATCPCNCHGQNASVSPVFVARANIRNWVFGHCSKCGEPTPLVAVIIQVARTGEGQATLYCQRCVKDGALTEILASEDEIEFENDEDV